MIRKHDVSNDTGRKRRADLKRLRELLDKGFHTLTDAEREEQSELLDRLPDLPRSWFKSPSPRDLARLRRKLGRGPGRPKHGGGAKRVLITMEPTLLRRIDAYAKNHDLSRSELLARAAEQLVNAK